MAAGPMDRKCTRRLGALKYKAHRGLVNLFSGSSTACEGQSVNPYWVVGADTRETWPMRSRFRFNVNVDVAQTLYAIAAIIAALHT